MKSLPFKPKTRTTFYLCSLFLTLLFISHQSFGQSFTRYYGSPNISEGGNCLQPDTAGGNNNGDLYIGGFRGDSALVMLVDANGAPIWERTFMITTRFDSEQILDILIDSDGNLVMCGTGGGGANAQGFAFKFDPNLQTILWSRENGLTKK